MKRRDLRLLPLAGGVWVSALVCVFWPDAAWTTGLICAIAAAALLVPPIHLFAQLRGAYLLGRFGAGWRTLALLGFCFAVLVGFAALLLVHGLTE